MQTSGKRGEKPGDFRSRLPECRLSWRSKECKRAESAAKSRGIFAVAPPSAACLGEAKSANERKARRKAGGIFAVACPSAACLGEAKSANERKAQRKAGGIFAVAPPSAASHSAWKCRGAACDAWKTVTIAHKAGCFIRRRCGNAEAALCRSGAGRPGWRYYGSFHGSALPFFRVVVL